ncbi:MAG: LysR family transcriptional regulator [Bacillota bacterium]|nr:LysR family transcriptional regulator [Bacillota bacterium]
MNLINYLAFIKVCELGNITKAAKELGYSQPGVSHMLEALEEDMGFPLLIRNKSTITPTEDGKRILPYCYQIIKSDADMHQTADAINGLLDGKIRISSFNSMLVNFTPKVIREFTNIYSNIEISIQEGAFSEIIDDLQNNVIDIGFISRFEEKGLEFLPLFDDPVCLIMSENHPFAAYDTVPIEALNGCDFIMSVPGWDDLVIMVQQKKRFSPNIKHYLASDTGAISMVAENLGVYILSKIQSSLLPDNVVIKEFSENVYRTLGIGIRSSGSLTPSLKKFILMSQELAKPLKKA